MADRILDALRKVNWSRSYLWEVDLEGAPAPYGPGQSPGLPVVDVDAPLAMGFTYDISSGIQLLRVPLKTQAYDVRLTIYDDENGTLEKFFTAWYQQIYNPKLGVLPIHQAVRRMVIKKLSSRRKLIDKITYWVFPNGTLLLANKGDSGPRQYSIEFVVARKENDEMVGIPSGIVSDGQSNIEIYPQEGEGNNLNFSKETYGKVFANGERIY
jgi:hypothetical protein